ncbi:MAG: flagellin [Porticoccaceae bacterium]
MSVINTNITSLIAQGNLGKSQSALQTSMERLSSGLRINSAKDDAAGQAIANRMTAQITGLNQAQRNANDGISIAQTAEGSLNQVNDNLQRIRELAVQAANGTNSPDDLQSIQDEIDQRLEEIDRISAETNFNGVKVLASDQGLTIQVGANDNETITVNLKEINRETLGLAHLDVRGSIASGSLSEVAGPLVAAQEATTAKTVALDFQGAAAPTVDFVVGDDGALYAQVGTDLFAATYDADTHTVSYDTDGTAAGATATSTTTFVNGGTLVELSDLGDAVHDNAAPDPSFEVHQNDTTGALVISDGTDTWTVGSGGTTIDLETGVVTLGTADATAVDTTTGYTQVTNDDVLTVPGTAAVAAVEADLADVDDALDGDNTLLVGEDGAYFIRNEAADGNITYYSATVDDTDGSVTLGARANVDPLSTLDAALNQVDSLRSELGAVQNRFEDAINNLNTNATNLSAARSRIEDADYAVEVANMTRAQILQQAGVSVLAQANQVPQTVLSLLR